MSLFIYLSRGCIHVPSLIKISGMDFGKALFSALYNNLLLLLQITIFELEDSTYAWGHQNLIQLSSKNVKSI